MLPANILVVDDEPDICSLVQEILQDEGLTVEVAGNGAEAKQLKEEFNPDLILLDIWMPDIDGISVLKEWKENNSLTAPVVMMSGHGTVETAVEATRLGAYDFIEKPLSLAKLLLTVKHALENTNLVRENKRLQESRLLPEKPVGKSPAMQSLREQLDRIANHNTPILIFGENGTDKEHYAQYIHDQSDRQAKAMISIGFTALNGQDAGKELFGYENGSEINPGLLEKANGGTVYLKDIADTDSFIQGKLYAALESKQIQRLGGSISIPIDIRVIAATREDLEPRVRAGGFRDDLYYLLSVVPVEIPPLRDHAEDIPELLDYYVNIFVERENLSYRRFSVAAQNRLRRYEWPGNLRELRNFIQRLLILGNDEVIEVSEVDAMLSNTDADGNSSE